MFSSEKYAEGGYNSIPRSFKFSFYHQVCGDTKKMRQVGRDANTHKIVFKRPEENILFMKLMDKWDNNIKMNFNANDESE